MDKEKAQGVNRDLGLGGSSSVEEPLPSKQGGAGSNPVSRCGVLGGQTVQIKVVSSQQLTKEELKLLIQSIRDCEQRSFKNKEMD